MAGIFRDEDDIDRAAGGNLAAPRCGTSSWMTWKSFGLAPWTATLVTHAGTRLTLEIVNVAGALISPTFSVSKWK